MSDPVAEVLRLVAEGRLTADEAAPILDALESREDAGSGRGEASPARHAAASDGGPRFARIEVFDGGRSAVNLRIPLSLGRMALAAIPGLAGPYADQINEAIASGDRGSVLDVTDADGDGVRVILE